ncbi:MAG: response regulator [Myxococcota bacterium]
MSDLLRDRLAREKRARRDAERLGEEKTRELFEAKKELQDLNQELQQRIDARTTELREARDEAVAASAAKSAFFATMSHELRTPLNAIVGMTELLLDSSLSREQRTMLRRVLAGSESLLAIIDDLLDISRIESGHLDIREESFDPRELVEGVCESLAVAAGQQSLELVCDVDAEMPEQLRGDEQRLRQALVNLVGNAIKFTAQGHVAVSARYESGSLIAQVEDTGPGISEADQERIFQRFVRVGEATQRGTGLGLNISQMLLTRMGGTIRVESELGRGSVFEIAVPLPKLKDASKRRPLQGVRVGLRDSLPRSKVAIQRILESAGAEVVESDPEVWIAAEGQPRFDSAIPNVLLAGHLDAEAALAKPVRQTKLLKAVEGALRPSRNDASSVRESRVVADRFRVLVAEDDPDNRGLIARWLQRHGYVADLARDGKVAFEKFRRFRYDVVLTDLEMPTMDGLALIRAIRQAGERSETPIVALTAHALSHVRNEALEAGVTEFLTKPFRTDSLLATLGRVVDARPVVLVVDDDPSNRLIVARHLSHANVVSVPSGHEALETLRRQRISLALVDLQMPGMDGFACARGLRVLARDLPLIAMSASTDPATAQRARDAGFDDVLAKPLRKPQLLALLEDRTDGAVSAQPDVEDLLEGFFRRRWADVTAVDEGLRAEDHEAVRRIGHGLKGVGGAYGFPALSNVGAALEQAAETGDVSQMKHHGAALAAALENLVVRMSDGSRLVVRELRGSSHS